MNLYDVKGYDTPLLLSEEHAELIGATLHRPTPRPKANGSVGDWREYAVSQGGDPVALESMTRAQIIESYGTSS